MGVKMYKGFDKDLKCRGFQYEIGKIYETDKAELCKEGVHACENPLDIFGYYSPANSRYCEVELDGVSDKRDDDTKRVGKRIKIGAELSVRGICNAHFEYVRERTTHHDAARDYSSLAVQDYSSLAAQDGSSLAARNWSSLAARNWSSLAAQDYSSLAVQDYSSLAVRNYSSLAAQDYSSLAAQNCSSLAVRNYSSLAARNWSSLAARNWSSLAVQDYSSLAAQDCSSLAAQDYSSLAAQNCSSLAAQDYSSLAAGKDSVLAAVNSKARAGMGSLIALAKRELKDDAFIITDFAAGIVDGKNIKPDTWYTVKDGKFVEWEE